MKKLNRGIMSANGDNSKIANDFNIIVPEVNTQTNDITSVSATTVNPKAKDRLFQTAFSEEKRLRELEEIAIGRHFKDLKPYMLQPVLLGNKENDLGILAGDVVCIFWEEQSYNNPGIVFREMQYAIEGLLNTVDNRKKLLYGSQKILLPIPKLYLIKVGIESLLKKIPDNILYEEKLSDLFYKSDKNDNPLEDIKPDLEATLHVYDYHMTPDEIVSYIEDGNIPERFKEHINSLFEYAITANCLTYITYVNKHTEKNKLDWVYPKNLKSVPELIKLLISRNIYPDLFTKREVYDMTLAEFSRDELIRYQEREMGREEGREEGEVKTYIKLITKKIMKNKTIEVILDEMDEEADTVMPIYTAIKMNPDKSIDEIFNIICENK